MTDKELLLRIKLNQTKSDFYKLKRALADTSKFIDGNFKTHDEFVKFVIDNKLEKEYFLLFKLTGEFKW